MSESATNTSLDIKIDVTSRRECGRKGLARFLSVSSTNSKPRTFVFKDTILEYHLVAVELRFLL